MNIHLSNFIQPYLFEYLILLLTIWLTFFSPHLRRFHQYSSPIPNVFFGMGEEGGGCFGVFSVINPFNLIEIDCRWIIISDISAIHAYLELNAGNSYYSKREYEFIGEPVSNYINL
jgi:hypothetical protein